MKLPSRGTLSSRILRRPALADVVLVAALIVLLVGATYLVTGPRADGDDRSPVIAVVGDSVTAGSYNRVVWPTLLGQRTGLPVANFALPGAGFVADGGGGHAFTYQVDRAIAVDPTVVLIVAGQGDDGLADLAPLRSGVYNVVNKVIVSGRRALVVGPTWYENPVPDAVRRVSDSVRQVAVDAGVPFLDALDPPWLTRQLMRADLTTPTDAGQSVIAVRVAGWLRSEGLA